MKKVIHSGNANNIIDIKERMEAGILGFAIGDALGVPIEFSNRYILEQNPVKEMIGYGSHNVPEGTWSDDTSLLIATIDSIYEHNSINYNDIMNKFVEWLDYAKYTATDKVFDIGNTTRKALLNYKNGHNPINCGPKEVYDNGNGSLMRILPFVYYLKVNNFSQGEQVSIINQASSLTHGHEISCLGCKIYADYISLLLDGIDKNIAYQLIKKNNYEQYFSKESINEYNRILFSDLSKLLKSEIKSTGYVVDTLEASIWCTLNNDTFEDALVSAINLGGDTDTIGAICGSMNGIIYGKNSIPKRWIVKLRKREELEKLSFTFVDLLNSSKQNKLL